MASSTKSMTVASSAGSWQTPYACTEISLCIEYAALACSAAAAGAQSTCDHRFGSVTMRSLTTS
jgi:hypothetical protein